ncbi:hypothetical protein O3G_MSEX000432, partial [Manduca sexta]
FPCRRSARIRTSVRINTKTIRRNSLKDYLKTLKSISTTPLSLYLAELHLMIWTQTTNVIPVLIPYRFTKLGTIITKLDLWSNQRRSSSKSLGSKSA